MAKAKTRKAPRKSARSPARKAAGARPKSRSASAGSRPPLKPGPDGVVLLSGGNPQIPKGEGDAPVKAYLAAIPGWKRDAARRLNAIIEREVPGVRKAVKWNSPLYGIDGQSWFVSFHCFDKYVKVTFFKGTLLKPVPPGTSKHATVRYLDVREGDLDEGRFADWVRQASKLPGEVM